MLLGHGSNFARSHLSRHDCFVYHSRSATWSGNGTRLFVYALASNLVMNVYRETSEGAPLRSLIVDAAARFGRIADFEHCQRGWEISDRFHQRPSSRTRESESTPHLAHISFLPTRSSTTSYFPTNTSTIIFIRAHASTTVAFL